MSTPASFSCFSAFLGRMSAPASFASTLRSCVPASSPFNCLSASVSISAMDSPVLTFVTAAVVPNFFRAIVVSTISEAPAFAPAASSFVTRAASSAGSWNWPNVVVTASTDVLRSSPDALERMIASFVTVANASALASSSGLADPTRVNASRIFAPVFTISPSPILIVVNPCACCSNLSNCAPVTPVMAERRSSDAP